VEECSKTVPRHPKIAIEALRSGCYFTNIYIDNNNMDAGEFLFQFSHTSFGKVSCLGFLPLF
jgi:hypothetical protein